MVAVILGKVQSGSIAGGRFDPLARVVQTVVGAPGSGVDSLLERGSQNFAGFFNGPALKARIRELEAQKHLFENYNDNVAYLETRLAEALKMANLPDYVFRMDDGMERTATKIPGQIIQYYPTENRLTLNIGSKQGVTKGSAVVSGDGLVGIIHTVDTNRSQVQMICSPLPFQIGASIQCAPPVATLIHGEAIDRLLIETSDKNATIKPGDAVITSGLSTKIPGGIPIGRVLQISPDQDRGSRLIQVFPSVQLAQVREVYVLR